VKGIATTFHFYISSISGYCSSFRLSLCTRISD